MNSATLWRLAAAGFTALVLIAGSVVAWALLRPHGEVKRETETESFTHNISRLVFEDFEASDIVVRSGGGPEIQITRVYKWTGDKPQYSQAWSGDTLTIAHNCGDADDDDCSIKYTVTAPAGIEVQAGTSSGDATVTGVTGQVDVSTVSGDLRAERLTSKANLTTVSGDLTLDDSSSRTVKATTVSGDLRLSFNAAPQSVSATTTSGDLTIGVPTGSGAYHLQASTVSGEQKVNVDSSATSERLITAKTVSGDLTVSYR